MANSTQPRTPIETSFKTVALPLAAQQVWSGTAACIDTATNNIKKAAAANATLIKIGEFAESVDNTGGLAPQVLISLDREITLRWYENAAGGSAITALFSTAYWLDDHTLTNSAAGNSSAGRVWAIDPVKGVAIQSTL